MMLREPKLGEVKIMIPFIPPSVNHYKKPKNGGRGYYVTAVAKRFKEAVAVLSKGSVDSSLYKVTVRIFLGKNQRGDAANFEKCIGDGLQDAGIITNDSKIRHYDIHVDRDWENPRTEIHVAPYHALGAVAVRPTRGQALENVLKAPAGRPCSLHGAVICLQCHKPN